MSGDGGEAMAATKEDVLVLLKLDEVHRPSTEARKFSYSDELAAVVREGTFFETYGLDSDERFWINEIATYHELLADLWSQGIVDQSFALDWSGAMFNWKLTAHMRYLETGSRTWTSNGVDGESVRVLLGGVAQRIPSPRASPRGLERPTARHQSDGHGNHG
jgi:hypothetical protein